MPLHRSLPRRRAWCVALAATTAVALTACSAGSLGSSSGGGDGDGVEISWLVDNAAGNVALAEGVAEAFMAENPDVTVTVEQRPGGAEGDNIIKTRLATGDMNDLFLYNSGSLLQALDPARNLQPLDDQAWVESLDPTFAEVVSSGDSVYGAPLGTSFAGAILYNRAVYEELGLEVPETWDDFMANNQAILDAGDVTPVLQTYTDTWTSQLLVLGDFANVAAADPDFAEQYTANEAKFATTPAALAGFQHLQEVHDAGYLNEDFASTAYAEGLQRLASGEAAHFPMLTSAALEIEDEAQLADIGVFAIPGDDAATNAITVWSANGLYVPTTTEGPQLEAVQELLAFAASPAGCDAQSEAFPPTGPYAVTDCTLPDDVAQSVQDLVAYYDRGAVSPALEFLSPIKGPALEQITVEVGSGIRSAEDGAALYDEDVRKQAQQLGLEGWS